MRTAEQNFWASLRKKVPQDIWAQRIENALVAGMPDVFISAQKSHQSWLELKAMTLPKRRMTPWLKRNDIRLAQLNWHIKAYSMDVRSFLGLRCFDEEHNNHSLHIIPGKLVPEAHTFAALEWNEWRVNSYDEFWDWFR